MVEQDYLISRAVELIFAHPKLKTQLAMRGGTVLHRKGHLAPAARYSEDIDLVLVEPRRSHRGIREDLANALKPLLGKPAESVITSVTLFVRNLTAKSKIARLTYQYGPTDPILRDEIGHVAVGNYWYRWLCQQRALDPIATYAELATTYSAPRLRGPFNLEARRAAGFNEDELTALVAAPIG